MAAPTFAAETESVWNTATTPKTGTVTVNTDDLLCVLCGNENWGGANETFGTPTGGGLTYALAQQHAVGSNANAAGWTTTGNVGSFTLSCSQGAAVAWWGFNALRFTGSGGVGNTVKNTPGNTTVSITTTQANSAIACIAADWNAADGSGGRTYSTATAGAATEQTYFRDAAHYGVYVWYHADAGAAGAKTVGLTAPGGTQLVIVAIEVLGTAGASPRLTQTLIVPPYAVTHSLTR